MASGLMDFFSKPEFAMWLGGVGRGLSQAGQPGGQFDMSQTNMMLAQRAAQEKRKEKLSGLMEQMGMKPEMREGLMGGLPYEVLAQGVAGQMFGGQDKKAEWERKAENLMAMGAPQDVAFGLQTGRYKTVTDPITRETRVVDMATGQPYQGWQPPQQEAPQASAQGGGVPAQGAPAQPQGGGAPQTGFGIDDTVDYTDTLGLEGVFKAAVNWLSDITGQGLLYENADKAANTLNNLQVRTQTALQDAVPGRPSNYLLQRIEGLTVTPSSIRQGPESALNTLRDTRQVIVDGIRENEEIMRARVSPKAASDARAANIRLKTLQSQYDHLISSMEAATGGGRQQQQDGAPEIGTVEDGFRYIGPDPADPNSWEKVQ